MPKNNKAAVKTKNKLSPEERSRIAKERWAKHRAAAPSAEEDNTPQEAPIAPAPPSQPQTPPQTQPAEQPPAVPESSSAEDYAPPMQAVQRAPVLTQQLPPAAPKKQKKYTGPKEFSVALKAAESRLAKAIVERAQAAGQLAALQAEIPSLIGIIQALKGSQVNVPAMPYDFPASVPNTMPFPAPIAAPQMQTPMNLQAVMQAAPQPPTYRSPSVPVGGAMQFGPEVTGGLEGPEDDDDIDKFITGPAASGGGWIGG